MSSSLEPDGKARDIAFLDAYALERWECVLHYMVGSAQTEGISADAVRILLHAGLMTRYWRTGLGTLVEAGTAANILLKIWSNSSGEVRLAVP